MKLLDRDGWKIDDFSRDDGAAAARIVLFADLGAALAAGDGQRVGVDLDNDVDPALLRPLQSRLALIAIPFPRFTDGRGFSLGRRLREQGYEGRLRATGEIVADQFAFLIECGFDEVEIGDERAARQPIEQWLAQTRRFSLAYQHVAGRTSIFERRRAARAAA